MSHVFISYVRENGDVVDRLVTELKSRGVTVWLDRNDIEPGARWRDAIKKAIRDGKFFLACFSKEYNERDRSYMNEELTLAIDELRERPSSRTWFIPVLINETVIPSRSISRAEDLSDIQAVGIHENWSDGVRRILKVIQHDNPVSARMYYLIGVLQQPFHNERLFALQQLGSIGPAAADAVPALAAALKDPDADVRRSAASALGRIGSAAVPALAETLKDQDAFVRWSAAEALWRIGPAAVPALAEALKNPNEYIRASAAIALREIGPAAADAVPALAAALKDPDADVRRSAAEALGSIGPVAADAVPALAAALKDPTEYVRRSAAEALNRVQFENQGFARGKPEDGTARPRNWSKGQKHGSRTGRGIKSLRQKS